MSRSRLFFTCITIFLLVGAGTAWILSNQGVIPNSWSSPLGTTFSILGVLFAFFQWMIPLPAAETKAPVTSSGSNQAQETFLKQIYDRISQGNGALVIYEKGDNVGKDIELRIRRKNSYGVYGWDSGSEHHSKANIVERFINGSSLIAAVFPDLTPDYYEVRSPTFDLVDVTVLPGQVAEIDWRKDRRKEERRQMRQTGLRTDSFIIGLGGVVFLMHKYLMIPYLDIAGIILIGLGTLSLGIDLLRSN